jgi:NADPH:quinone reductase-like Zn-dependent oxidoreductase
MSTTQVQTSTSAPDQSRSSLTSRLVLTAVGGNLVDTVSLEAGPDREPGIDDVVVAIEAAPINGADLLFAAGWFAVYPQVPAAMGAEGVGRVIGAGTHVDPGLLGRLVVILPTFRYGTWAARTVVPARNVIAVPDRADVLQLAMLPVNPAAAYALLNDYTALRPGDWVGLNLANSAIGHYLIALARKAGVRTLAVVRREDVANEMRQLGSDLVVVDGAGLKERVAEGLKGARLRVLFEGTGNPGQVAQLVPAVEDGGSVITFAAVTGQAPALPLADLIYRGITLRAFFILNWLRDTPRKRLERVYGELAELVEQGAISAVIEATYPLDQYQQALRHAQKNARAGKVLFVPNGPAAKLGAAGT